MGNLVFPEPIQDFIAVAELPFGENPGRNIEFLCALQRKSVWIVAKQQDNFDRRVILEIRKDRFGIGATT